MNRNTESHFSVNPINLDIQRSKFVRPSTHKTTFNAGNLIPIYVDEVLPGDTFKMNMSSVIRMSTPIYPVMDNANLDVYFFFVPNRLVWDHWKEFFGISIHPPREGWDSKDAQNEPSPYEPLRQKRIRRSAFGKAKTLFL